MRLYRWTTIYGLLLVLVIAAARPIAVTAADGDVPVHIGSPPTESQSAPSPGSKSMGTADIGGGGDAGQIQVSPPNSSENVTRGTIQVSGGTNTGPEPPPAADFAALLAAVAWWCFALFLLFQAGRIHKWQLDGEGVPETSSAVVVAVGVAALVLIAWGGYVRTVLLWSNPFVFYGVPPEQILLLPDVPRLLVPGIIVSMMFPAAGAVYRFMVIAMAARSLGRNAGALGIAGTIISVVHLCASIATLVMARTYFFPAPK